MPHYVLNEYLSNGYESGYVLLISLISIFFGVLIIIAKNPVISILFLIGLFISVSVYLMLLGLCFMGLSYLLVYVGAVSILFIFILMLISVRVSELLTEGKNSIPLAIITVLAFNFTVSSISTYSIYVFDLLSSYLSSFYRMTTTQLFSAIYGTENVLPSGLQEIDTRIASVTGKSWDSSLIESDHITSIGNVMYTNLFIFLIITSLILLVAMVGTIVITKKQ
jgi:NADH-ubiquinone oxidoreductase chain 6